MKKIKKGPEQWNYAEFYSSDYMMRTQKNLKLTLIILAIAFFGFIISMTCMYIFYK